METLKKWMIEEFCVRKKKGGNSLIFIIWVWLICSLLTVHCRLKTFLTKQQTCSLITPGHYSRQHQVSHTGCISFFFLILCGCHNGKSEIDDSELEFPYPQTFSASSASSAGHMNDDDDVDAAATVRGSTFNPVWRDSWRSAMYRIASISALFSDSKPCPFDVYDNNNKKRANAFFYISW